MLILQQELRLANIGSSALKLTKSCIILVLWLISGISVLMTSCQNDIDKVNFLTQKKVFPLETTHNAEIIYSDSGHVVARIISKHIDRYAGDTNYVEFPKGLKLEFFKIQGEVESELTAKYAIRKSFEGVMEARDSVVVKNKKGEILTCEHLIWNEKTHKIYSPKFVKIQTKDETIWGNGFEANEDFTRWKIFKVTGTLSIKNEQNN